LGGGRGYDYRPDSVGKFMAMTMPQKVDQLKRGYIVKPIKAELTLNGYCHVASVALAPSFCALT
jgi:hypothetical protein